MQYPILQDTVKDGSGYRSRDFNGWLQVREWAGGKACTPRRFYVSGFDETDCSVLRADKSLERVPCSEAGRIKIDGKWYGRKHWDH